MDQPTGNPKDIFDAIVADLEIRKSVREFDNTDHSGGANLPTAQQISDAKAVIAKARELRRLLSS
jgi:hypothetical protein